MCVCVCVCVCARVCVCVCVCVQAPGADVQRPLDHCAQMHTKATIDVHKDLQQVLANNVFTSATHCVALWTQGCHRHHNADTLILHLTLRGPGQLYHVL